MRIPSGQSASSAVSGSAGGATEAGAGVTAEDAVADAEAESLAVTAVATDGGGESGALGQVSNAASTSPSKQ